VDQDIRAPHSPFRRTRAILIDAGRCVLAACVIRMRQ
jgi:hypothetical protein